MPRKPSPYYEGKKLDCLDRLDLLTVSTTADLPPVRMGRRVLAFFHGVNHLTQGKSVSEGILDRAKRRDVTMTRLVRWTLAVATPVIVVSCGQLLVRVVPAEYGRLPGVEVEDGTHPQPIPTPGQPEPADPATIEVVVSTEQ